MRLWTLSVCAATRRRCFPILINLLSPRLASWKNLKSWSCRQLQAAERQRQLRWHHQETAQRGMRACPANCGDKHQKGRRQSTSKKREIARRCQSEARTQWLNPPWQKGSLSISSLNKSFFFRWLIADTTAGGQCDRCFCICVFSRWKYLLHSIDDGTPTNSSCELRKLGIRPVVKSSGIPSASLPILLVRFPTEKSLRHVHE